MAAIILFYIGVKERNPAAKIFDRLICWWTKSDFSHVESVVSIDTHEDVIKTIKDGRYLRTWSASTRDNKVRQTLIYPYKTKWVCVVLEGYDKKAIEDYWKSVNGSFYDYPGVFGFVFKFIKQVNNWVYCSEGVSQSLRRSALPGFAIPPEQLSPGKLFDWCLAQSGVKVLDLE